MSVNFQRVKEYQEWVDFITDISYEVTPRYNNNLEVSYMFFFRNQKEELLGHIKTFLETKDNAWNTEKETTLYVIDTISSSAYEKHMSDTSKKFFQENGYTGTSIEWFGPTMLRYVLWYTKKQYAKTRVVLMNSHARNEPQIWRLVQQVQTISNNLIQDYKWWGERYPVTIFLKK